MSAEYMVIYAIIIDNRDDPYPGADFKYQFEKWLESPAGIWAKEHSQGELLVDTLPSIDFYSSLLRIQARFTKEDFTYWKLKFL